MEILKLLPETSEKSNVILSQLMKAKVHMGNFVKKDSSNPFHKSKYASLGAHLEVSNEALIQNGLIMLHTTNLIGDQIFLIATLHHPESGQWIKSYFPLPNPKNDSQGVGSSLTYMRRYSLNSMLGLSAEDDDGEASSGRGKNTQDKGAFLDKQEQDAVTELLEKLDEEGKRAFFDWIKKKFIAETIQNIPKSHYGECIFNINSKIKYINNKKRTEQVGVA